MNNFKLKKGVFRCCFDVLKPLILFEEVADFQPATFVVNAEWPLSKAKVLTSKKSPKLDNLLEMPPGGAIITIVIL